MMLRRSFLSLLGLLGIAPKSKATPPKTSLEDIQSAILLSVDYIETALIPPVAVGGRSSKKAREWIFDRSWAMVVSPEEDRQWPRLPGGHYMLSGVLMDCSGEEPSGKDYAGYGGSPYWIELNGWCPTGSYFILLHWDDDGKIVRRTRMEKGRELVIESVDYEKGVVTFNDAAVKREA